MNSNFQPFSKFFRIIDNIKKLDKNYNYEIIVADGNSTDKTREIAVKRGQ